MNKRFFTSESVTESHPDKTSDAISDSLLDAFIKEDKYSRVAIETLVTTGLVIIAGEVTSKGYVDIQGVVRNAVRELGYTNPEYEFDYKSCGVLNAIHEQSPDIAQGVIQGDPDANLGAGDQGCLKKGTLVRTKNGFIKIEEIKKGDYVLTPSGFKKVLNSVMTGVKKVIRITLKNGMSLDCTPDHKILCYDCKGVTYWKAANELTFNDNVCTTKPSVLEEVKEAVSVINRSTLFTKFNHKVYGSEEIILNDKTGYLIGELIGDGSVTKANSMELIFGNNLTHLNQVKQFLADSNLGNWRFTHNKDLISYSLKVDSVLLRKHFEKLGVNHVKSFEKTTPLSIFTSPKNVIASYLRGLFDSDGTIVVNTGRTKSNIRIRLCSSSLTLLKETQLLLNEFGIKSTILFNRPKGTLVGKNPKYKSNHDNYVLNLSGFESYQNFGSQIGFFDSKKNERMTSYLNYIEVKPQNSRAIYVIPHPTKNEWIDEAKLGLNLPFQVTSFKEKQELDYAEVYDLEVEGIHMFSGNGFYVHNSMFGYACNETPELMPLPITLANSLTRKYSELRKNKKLSWARPDGKSQVTVEYHDGKPIRVDTVVMSVQHDDISIDKVRKELTDEVIKPVLGKWIDDKTIFHINPTGRFVIGGPTGDTGVTGRKLSVDSYGGRSHEGGGAKSGKDPTKVDRSAAYAARYIAKNLVAAGVAPEVEVQLSYAIGVKDPVSIYVDAFGNSKFSTEVLEEVIRKHFPLSPAQIIKHFDLRRPIYFKTASFGHFGRSEFPWEKTDKVQVIKKELKL